MKLSNAILAALLGLFLLAMVAVRADDAEDVPAEDLPDVEDVEDVEADYAEQQRDPNAITGLFARATFGNDLSAPRTPAGESIATNVVFSNEPENPAFTVAFVVASITHVADTNYYMQNFSATRHSRIVNGGETHNFRYKFTPDANLDPNDYGLVMRVYFVNDNNQTYVTVAYNDTITITDPLGADPKTFMTFGTIAAIVGGVGYFVAGRKKRSPSRSSAGARKTVEMGTGESYDPDYVSAEHIKFSERKKSASPKRSSSAKK